MLHPYAFHVLSAVNKANQGGYSRVQGIGLLAVTSMVFRVFLMNQDRKEW